MLNRILLLSSLLILSACLEESSDTIDKKAFTRIYDNNQFHDSFQTLDMKQTADGGYLILGGRTSVFVEDGESQNVNKPMTPYILKTDAYGKIVTEKIIDTQALSFPIGGLHEIDDVYHFFCMDAITKAVSLVRIDALAENHESVAVAGLALPLASSTYGGSGANKGLLLLSYDNSTQESVVSRIRKDGTVDNSRRFYTGAESPIDGLVVAHANREGTQYPFAVGETSTGFYFNGFIDYTFALVFTGLSENEDVDGRINGQQANSGFSSILNLSASRFAISTYSFGFNFLSPTITLGTSGSVTDLQHDAYSFPELENNARIKIIRAVLNGRNVVIYASNTKSGQIGLYVYDEATGEFISSKYVGYSNPFEIGALLQTPEGDLVVSGTTYIAGRLARMCLIKIPQAEL